MDLQVQKPGLALVEGQGSELEPQEAEWMETGCQLCIFFCSWAQAGNSKRKNIQQRNIDFNVRTSGFIWRNVSRVLLVLNIKTSFKKSLLLSEPLKDYS